MKRLFESLISSSIIARSNCAIGFLLLALLCSWMKLNFGTAELCLLLLITALSLLGNFITSIIFSILAAICLTYFFTPPVFTFFAVGSDIVTLITFLTTSIVITGLAAEVNKMAADKLEQGRAALAHFAQLTFLGGLTASIAHEVEQPLAEVVSSANACQRWLTGDPPNLERASHSVAHIIRDANRVSELVIRVRELAESSRRRTLVNINEVAQEIVALARGEIKRGRISLHTRFSDDLPPILADRIQLQQVVLSLVLNAIEALGEQGGGPRYLFISSNRDEADSVALTVRDSGKGLELEATERVFDAFYTTKRDGVGMGLTISRGIIEAHGGRLWAMPNDPVGAVFEFVLPVHKSSPSP